MTNSTRNSWNDLPLDVFKHITQSLDVRDIASSRLVCKGWRRAVSSTVNEIQPRLDGSAFSVQFHHLGQIQDTFPFINTLDFRRTVVTLGQVSHFDGLKWLQRLRLSLFAFGRLQEAIAELQELALAFQKTLPQVKLIVELGTSLGQFMSDGLVKDGPDHVSDADLFCLGTLTESVKVTQLTLPRTYWLQTGLTRQGLQQLGGLTSLRSLHLLTASHSLDDTVLQSLARLTQMEDLTLGNIQDVTDAGLVKGLQSMSSLHTLALHHIESITDVAWRNLAQFWPVLIELSLTHAQQLGDAGLASLSSLPRLRRCFVSGSPLVTQPGMDALDQTVDALEFRACRNCVRSC